MTPSLLFIASMSALVSMIGIPLLLFRRTRRRGKQLALAGLVACFGASGFGVYRDDVAAREAGFQDREDMRAALKEGVTDPTKWREIADAAVAKEKQQREAGARAMAAGQKLKTAAQFHPAYVAYEETTDAVHVTMMSRAMDEIRKRLRDPQSAQFRNVHLVTGATGITFTCGEVNAKNGFGGYGGFSGFISNGVSESSLASDFKNAQEFLRAWKHLCH